MRVLALPKASRTVLSAWIWAAMRDSFFECAERRRIWERNRRRLEDFPEPVMPLPEVTMKIKINFFQKKRKENEPGYDSLGLVTPAHEQINLCGLFIKMGLEGPGRVDERNRSVPVAALLVVPGTEVVCVGKGLVRVDDDEVGIGNAGVGEVSTETGLEDGENSVVAGVYSELGGGGDEVGEVPAGH